MTDAEIIDAYERAGSVWKAAELLQMSGQQVHTRLIRAGYSLPSTRFTKAEEEIITAFYEARSHLARDKFRLGELSASLKRPKTSIARVARRLGLTNSHRSVSPERKEEQSAFIKAWLEANGHPKGMLGKTHTPEMRARISEWTSRYWKEATEAELELRRVRANDTRRKNGFRPKNAGYSRGVVGKRPDLANQYFRSRWEANYARILNLQRDDPTNPLVGWCYEPDTFDFGGQPKGMPQFYTPDFKLSFEDGGTTYHEVKGWMDQQSRSRLRLMKQLYPDVSIRVIDAKAYKQLTVDYASSISEWES